MELTYQGRYKTMKDFIDMVSSGGVINVSSFAIGRFEAWPSTGIPMFSPRESDYKGNGNEFISISDYNNTYSSNQINFSSEMYFLNIVDTVIPEGATTVTYNGKIYEAVSVSSGLTLAQIESGKWFGLYIKTQMYQQGSGQTLRRIGFMNSAGKVICYQNLAPQTVPQATGGIQTEFLIIALAFVF